MFDPLNSFYLDLIKGSMSMLSALFENEDKTIRNIYNEIDVKKNRQMSLRQWNIFQHNKHNNIPQPFSNRQTIILCN